jgi:serine/threonine protein kinase
MSEESTKEELIFLEQHGWNGCSIPVNLENFLEKLPTWKNLKVLRPPESYTSITLYFPWDMFHDSSGNSYIPAMELKEFLSEGTYGKVFKARRALFKPLEDSRFQRYTPYQEIVSKQNDIEISEDEKRAPTEVQEAAWNAEIQAILYEATIHALVYHTLYKAGFPTAVPTMYEVFAFSTIKKPTKPTQISKVAMNMEYIAGKTLFHYLQTNMTPKTKTTNDSMLIDILIQLCVYLDILQDKLRFNHRDLKVNNILLRNCTDGWSRDIKHDSLSSPWKCIQDIVIIDFGFSCIACCDEDKSSLIQAGSWFKPSHECMKSGRDIALFLYSLQVYFPLQTRISAGLFSLLDNLMYATKSGKRIRLFDGISEYGVTLGRRTPTPPLEFNAGIYKFLRNSEVDVPGCAPKLLLAKLNDFLHPANATEKNE